MQIPSQPIDVSFRDNDYATSEDTNNQLPSGRTFDSFTEVVEESELESESNCFFNVEEEHHPQIINHAHSAGKEVISAYWFDGLKSSLI